MAQLIISDQDVRRIIAIGGTPTTGPHTFSFFYFDDDDIEVYVDGVLQVKTADYTVTPTVTNDDGFEGGTVTTTASLSDATLAIVLALPFAKNSNMSVNAAFDVATLNTTLSKFIAMLQTVREWKTRAITVPVDEEPSGIVLPAAAVRANGFMGFDSSGDVVITNNVLLGSVSTSSYGETLVNTSDSASNLALLGATSAGITMLTAATAEAQRTLVGAAGIATANAFTKTQTYTKGIAASALNLALGDGNVFSVTGSASITSFATKGVGTVVYLYFASTPLLTHHATNLILLGGANITAAAGDTAVFVEYGPGTWRCLSYHRASTSVDPADPVDPVTSTLPAGLVVSYGGVSAPTGWLLCNGAEIDRTTYADLFTAIGVNYGVGNGSTTFALPDTTGRVIAGKEASSTRLSVPIAGGTLGAVGGDQYLQAHAHAARAYSYPYDEYGLDRSDRGPTGEVAVTHTVIVDSFGSGSSQNVQPTIILNMIIKT